MFRVGQYVILNPKMAGPTKADEIGVVTHVEPGPLGLQRVTVFWEDLGFDDGGPWRSHWLVLV